MYLNLYVVRDSAADAYLPPFYERADGAAIRAFVSAILDPQHRFSQTAEALSLYAIGYFDDSNGTVTPKPPIFLGHGPDLVAAATKQRHVFMPSPSTPNA